MRAGVLVDEGDVLVDQAHRSAVLHQAVDLLRASQLADDYEAAWDEWSAGDDAHLWDTAAGDGLTS